MTGGWETAVLVVGAIGVIAGIVVFSFLLSRRDDDEAERVYHDTFGNDAEW